MAAKTYGEMVQFVTRVLEGDPSGWGAGKYESVRRAEHKRRVIRAVVANPGTSKVKWTHLKFPREWSGAGEVDGVYYELCGGKPPKAGARSSSAHRLFYRCVCGQLVPLGRAEQHSFGTSKNWTDRGGERAKGCVAAEEALVTMAAALRNNELAADEARHNPLRDKYSIDPMVLVTMIDRAFGREGVRWSVWENADMGSPDFGRCQFIMYGPGCTFTERPAMCPDTAECGLGWRYVYIGDVDLEAGRVVPVARAPLASPSTEAPTLYA